MKSKVFPWALPVIPLLLLALGGSLLAQTPSHTKFYGVINDFTPESTGGPWEVRGSWSLTVRGRYGKADFSAALTMERSDLGVMQNGGGNLNNPMDRMAHTHHITLLDACVKTIPGGFRVTGPASITANGKFPPPFGPELPNVTIEITGASGENSVEFSNITLLFGDPAAEHFGMAPLHGVVRTSE